MDAEQPRGAILDPSRERVDGVRAYPTAYAPGYLIISGFGDQSDAWGYLERAGAEFGWGVQNETLDGRPLGRSDDSPAEGTEVEGGSADTEGRPPRDQSDRLRATITRVSIIPSPRSDRDDEPVPPVDAWRLLQRARKRAREDEVNRRSEARTSGDAADEQSAAIAELPASVWADPLRSVSLDHVLTVDPIGVNPHGKSNLNPHGKSNVHPHGKSNHAGPDGYAIPGSGGHQVVSFIGGAPSRTDYPKRGRGRRPVVAFLDTGCGPHEWLPFVERRPRLHRQIIGIDDDATDPEVQGDLAGPLDGFLDDGAGHGTFVAGIIHQACPDADLVSVRVADSQGTVLESELITALEELAGLVDAFKKNPKTGQPLDVINLSLGYYHESPEDGLMSTRLHSALVDLRERGCAIVCSAGNDSTDRPAFPAALWNWPGADYTLQEPENVAPHVAVGALNPNGSSVALFSNVGGWVHTYAPGASVVSTSPPFNGGVQAGSRDDEFGRRRESLDPDDFTGGFAVWSGTSFAAPYVAGRIAAALAPALKENASVVGSIEHTDLVGGAVSAALKELGGRDASVLPT